MKLLTIIAEYNPFHLGHKYHLEKSLSKSKATHTLALMSSSFVQRGEPALLDKWTRAKMAVNNGVDLVIELPFLFSCQGAELFAQGAINILNSLKMESYLSFGSELGFLDPLIKISNILVEEPEPYKDILKKYLNEGNSFPFSRSKALVEILKEDKMFSNLSLEEILKSSNNILAIEYLKALKKTNSKIYPLTIKRQGSLYREEALDSAFSSARAIRNGIFRQGPSSIENYLPKESFFFLNEFYEKYSTFNFLNNYKTFFQYLLLMKDESYLKNILDLEPGLENRIKSIFIKEDKMEKIISSIASKRHTETRIQRILIHLLTGLNKASVKELKALENNYIRILASNSKGLEILSEIKKKSQVHIISKYSHYKALKNERINKFLLYEERATNLYFFGLTGSLSQSNSDFYISPIIDKKD